MKSLRLPCRLVLMSLLASGCLPVCLYAQVNPAASNIFTHESCVSDTRRLLGAFVGEYVVQVELPAAGASDQSEKPHASIRFELGGCVVVEHFDGMRGGEPYSYIAIWGTSGISPHRIQRAFVHSQHGQLGISEGGWNAAGDTLIVEDSAFVRGRWIHEQQVLSRPSEQRFVTEGRRSEDGGKTWLVTVRARYLRQ